MAWGNKGPRFRIAAKMVFRIAAQKPHTINVILSRPVTILSKFGTRVEDAVEQKHRSRITRCGEDNVPKATQESHCVFVLRS